ncbi:hypothetical protein KPMX200_71276 [Klebsiella pneumoniae]|nr:hypothetical protein KPMX200_71276 [Klebsiella pneumoniae]
MTAKCQKWTQIKLIKLSIKFNNEKINNGKITQRNIKISTKIICNIKKITLSLITF